MTDATGIILQIAILVFSVVIHEVSHGVAALLQGDKTAQYAGRLTLNPIPHIDPIGSVLIPLLLVITQSPILIGWAKPVPYNPYNLQNQKWGPALVGAAGPFSNIAVALVFSILLRLGNSGFLSFLPQEFLSSFIGVSVIIVLINILLAVFNLLPIPPLDGSKVLFSLLPYRLLYIQNYLEAYGFVILIIFIIFFSSIIWFLVSHLFFLFTGLGL